jgi:hypothetical protein
MSSLKHSTISSSLCPAKAMSPEQRKRISLEVIANKKTITCLASENSTSRKFVRQQEQNVQEDIDNIFDFNHSSNDDVLYR